MSINPQVVQDVLDVQRILSNGGYLVDPTPDLLAALVNWKEGNATPAPTPSPSPVKGGSPKQEVPDDEPSF